DHGRDGWIRFPPPGETPSRVVEDSGGRGQFPRSQYRSPGSAPGPGGADLPKRAVRPRRLAPGGPGNHQSAHVETAERVPESRAEILLAPVHPASTMAKLLIVEDNEMNRDMLSRRLQRRGFVTLIATDGGAGVVTARSEHPDLILMDMSLPVIDGWEATRQLKADPATAGIPIIALTAHAMTSDRDKALEAGCNDYDTKPVDLQRLLGKIDALLNSSPPATS